MLRSLEKTLGLDVQSRVFWTALFIIGLIVCLSLWNVDQTALIFAPIQRWIAEHTGWFLILCVNGFFCFIFYLLFSRFGHIRLGKPEDKPEFTLWGWFSMLFSAGMGIGLLFYGVAEPMMHYIAPPIDESQTLMSAQSAMGITFFHWGLHAWAIYATVGLSLAYFTFKQGLPLTFRSAFTPLLKEKAEGPIGDMIDTLAVIATLFGLTTSLGLGVQQINSGLYYLIGIPPSTLTQGILIAGVTLMATVSVVLGVDSGIRRLSEWNLSLGLFLLVFILILGPTQFIVDSLIQNTGYYLDHFISLSTWTESYQRSEWQNSWTIFYWAWWIAWSPFVGMFIARVSKGRTIKEFILGVLIVPTALTFIWITVFGGTALFEELHIQPGIAHSVQSDVTTAFFVLLERFPLTKWTSAISVIVIITFFVTSSDSGSLVIDMITSGGKQNPPKRQRVFWALTEGFVAFVLLAAGGLQALQTASIAAGLPFSFMLIAMVFSLMTALKKETRPSS